MHKKYCTWLAIVLLALAASENTWAEFRYDVVAVTGDAVPDGNGTFLGFGLPSLNDSRQVAFFAQLKDTTEGSLDNTGLYRSDGTSSLLQVARASDLAPNGNGTFFELHRPSLNNDGQVAFRSVLIGTNGGDSDNVGLYLYEDFIGTTQVVRTGNSGLNGTSIVSSLGNPALNNTGQVLFRGGFTNTSDYEIEVGFFRIDSTQSITPIVLEGDSVPDGNGSIALIIPLDFNDMGQFVFGGRLSNTIGGLSDSFGTFRGEGPGTLDQVVRKASATSVSSGKFTNIGPALMNGGGQVALFLNLGDTSRFPSDDTGLYLYDDLVGLKQVLRAGDLAPNANGEFLYFDYRFQGPLINDVGQIAFPARVGTNILTDFHRGLFITDSSGSTKQIALAGNTVPEGNGEFSTFENLAFSNSGQLAFEANLAGTSDTSSDDKGLYLYDDYAGLTLVARTGGSFLDSIIVDANFLSGTHGINDGERGLNDHSQLAYQFTLADGRQGIAIATLVPEPSTLLLSLLASVTWLYRKRD